MCDSSDICNPLLPRGHVSQATDDEGTTLLEAGQQVQISGHGCQTTTFSAAHGKGQQPSGDDARVQCSFTEEFQGWYQTRQHAMVVEWALLAVVTALEVSDLPSAATWPYAVTLALAALVFFFMLTACVCAWWRWGVKRAGSALAILYIVCQIALWWMEAPGGLLSILFSMMAFASEVAALRVSRNILMTCSSGVLAAHMLLRVQAHSNKPDSGLPVAPLKGYLNMV